MSVFNESRCTLHLPLAVDTKGDSFFKNEATISGIEQYTGLGNGRNALYLDGSSFLNFPQQETGSISYRQGDKFVTLVSGGASFVNGNQANIQPIPFTNSTFGAGYTGSVRDLTIHKDQLSASEAKILNNSLKFNNKFSAKSNNVSIAGSKDSDALVLSLGNSRTKKTLTDSSNYTGQVTGDTNFGKVGFRFNGISNHVDAVANQYITGINGGEFSIAARINPDIVDNEGVVMSLSSGPFLSLRTTTSGTLKFKQFAPLLTETGLDNLVSEQGESFGDPEGVSVDSSPVITGGQECSIFATYKTGQYNLYINGVPDISYDFNIDIEDVSNIAIGAEKLGGIYINNFDGAIQDVRVYNTAYDADRAKNEYLAENRNPDVLYFSEGGAIDYSKNNIFPSATGAILGKKLKISQNNSGIFFDKEIGDVKAYSFWKNVDGQYKHFFKNESSFYENTEESAQNPSLSIETNKITGEAGEYKFLVAYKTGPKTKSFIENEREVFRRYF